MHNAYGYGKYYGKMCNIQFHKKVQK